MIEPFPRAGTRPAPPRPPATPSVPLYRAVLLPADAAELQRLYSSTTARPVHKSFPSNHSARAASDRFSALLASLRLRGVPISLLAQSLDPPLTHQAVRERIRASAPPPPDLPAPEDAPYGPAAPEPPPPAAPTAPAAPAQMQAATVLLTDVRGHTRRVRLTSPAAAPPPDAPVLATAPQLLEWLALPRRTPSSVLTTPALAAEHLAPALAL